MNKYVISNESLAAAQAFLFAPIRGPLLSERAEICMKAKKMKKKLRYLILIILGIQLLAGASRASEKLEMSFEEALEVLRNKNENLMAARMEEGQREYEKAAAQGLYLPKIQFGMQYTRIDEPISIDLNDIRSVILGLHPAVPQAMVPSFELQVQDDTFWKTHVNALWPVFTGGQISAANRAADAFLDEAREKVRFTESTLTSELVKRYFGLRLARKVTGVRRQVLAGLDRHLFQARKLEENGMIARAERLHAEVSRSEAERGYKKALRDEGIAHMALASILSIQGDIVPTSPLFFFRKLEPLEVFRSRAADDNPILKQIGAKREAAHQAYRKELGTLYPQVFLFGRHELHREDLTVLEPEWAVGLGIHFTLFEGGIRANRVNAAKSMETRVSLLERRAKRDIETLAEKRYQELMKALDQLDALNAAIVSAKEYLWVRTRSFEEGFATSLDVVDAELALSRVEIETLVARYDFDVALAELLEASGESDKFEAYMARADLEVSF